MKYSNPNLLKEYTLILAGQKTKFGQEYLSHHGSNNEALTYEIFKMAIETFLHWTPEQALKRLNLDVIKRMRLDFVMKYMNLPYECEYNEDYTWILHKLYPEVIDYDQETHIIGIYKKILSGEKYKWPKWYFSNADGHERACICLRYMIEHNMHYETPQELYEQFISSSSTGIKLMNQLGLKTVVHDEFADPIVFVHEAMFPDDNDGFLYHYYRVQYYYNKAKKDMMDCIRAEKKMSALCSQ